MRISSRSWDCQTTANWDSYRDYRQLLQQLSGTQFQYGVTSWSATYNADENLDQNGSLGKHQLLFGGRVTASSTSDRVPDEIKDAFQFGDYATALGNASTYTSFSCHRYRKYGAGERRHIPGRSLLL